MSGTKPPFNVLSFPRGGGDEPAPGPPGAEPGFADWPPFPIEVDAPPSEARPWIEAQVSQIALTAMQFRRATNRLGTIDMAAVRADVTAFRRGTSQLIRTVEVIRLRRLELADQLAVMDGVRKLLGRLRYLRLSIFFALDSEVAERLARREGRALLSSRDLDDEIHVRSQRRQQGGGETRSARISLQGGLLPIPGPQQLATRQRRARRAELDARPINPQSSVAELMARLPTPWLTGIALRIAGGTRPKQRPDVAALVTCPRRLGDIIRSMSWGPRRILESLLTLGGVARYDHITHQFGPDDETAWLWPDDPPRTDLERLRRTGLLHAGVSCFDGAHRKVAVIPAELRSPLIRLLNEHPPPPVPLRPSP